MQIFIRTLLGETLAIEIQSQNTIGQLKNSIFLLRGFPVEQQRIIIAGRQVNNDEIINDLNIQRLESIHLVMQPTPSFSFDTHNLYVAVQNLYQTLQESEFVNLDRVIRISGHEDPAQLQTIFETIFQIREERIKKNRENPQNPANAFISLVAVKQDDQIKSLQNQDPTGNYPATANSSSLIHTGLEKLDCQFCGYMFEDNTIISYSHNLNTEMQNINQAFRLFCAQKKAQDPQYIEQIQQKIQTEFGEVQAYLDITAEALFDDPTTDPMVINHRRALLDGIINLGTGIEPPEDMAVNNAQLFDEILQFDIVSIAERFRCTRTMMSSPGEKTECEDLLRQLLVNTAKDIENKYLSGHVLLINNNPEEANNNSTSQASLEEQNLQASINTLPVNNNLEEVNNSSTSQASLEEQNLQASINTLPVNNNLEEVNNSSTSQTSLDDLYLQALTNLQTNINSDRFVSDIKYNDLRLKVNQLITHVETIKNKRKESTEDLIEILTSTNNVLDDGKTEPYLETANKIQGKPSKGLKLLGGLMMVIGGLITAVGITVSFAAPIAPVAGAVGGATVIGGVGLAAAGLGFFAKGSKRSGLSKDMEDVAEETIKTSPKS